MTAEPHVLSATPIDRRLPSPPPIPWWRSMYWSLRRELWENRSIYVAPLAVAPVAIVGFLVYAVGLPARIRATAGAPMKLHAIVQQPHDAVAGLLMLATLIVGVVYSIDALYGERRDRSIVFWKSLPVSDTTTVLTKATIPILILPLVGFAVTVALQLVMALMSSAILAANGLDVAAYWQALAFPQMSLLLLYHLVAVHGLSWAPVFAWMLLVSAWARRAPFLWALLPPVAIAAVERLAFNTSFFITALGQRISGSQTVISSAPGSSMPMDPMTTHITLGRFLGAPGFWLGLVLTAVFLGAAVSVRRRRVAE